MLEVEVRVRVRVRVRGVASPQPASVTVTVAVAFLATRAATSGGSFEVEVLPPSATGDRWARPGGACLYGIAPRKSRFDEKLALHTGLHPVWGFTGACLRMYTFHGPVPMPSSRVYIFTCSVKN